MSKQIRVTLPANLVAFIDEQVVGAERYRASVVAKALSRYQDDLRADAAWAEQTGTAQTQG